MSKPNILVVGSLNMDLILQLSVIPIAGENLIGSHYQYAHGGKGGNQAIAAAKIGADVTFVGCVGNDAFGDELISSLQKNGISTEYVARHATTSTGLAVIVLEDDGQNRIIVYPEANMALTTDDIDKVFERHFDGMIIQFEVPEDVVVHACKRAKEKEIPFIVDAGPAQDFPIEKIAEAEIFSPNETETYAMCGVKVTDIATAKAASQILKKRSYAKYIVIKSGANGSYIFDGETIIHTPAIKVKAIDATAAGDAFTAGMTVAYLKHKNIKEAVAFANIVGAVTVTKLGAQPSLPSYAEIEAFRLKARDE